MYNVNTKPPTRTAFLLLVTQFSRDMCVGGVDQLPPLLVVVSSVYKKIPVSQNFGQISRVSQSRF